jgi:serine/threonine protein kinase
MGEQHQDGRRDRDETSLLGSLGSAPTEIQIGPGAELGPYKIEALLGAGGMGQVFRARDTRLGRVVAIKVLPHDRVNDPERKRRFLQEARAASALNHPNIVTLHDIANYSGVDFLVMEYVEGKSLDKLIPSKGLPPGEALDYAAQIASALGAAHGAGVAHRDIKPGNAVVTSEGQVKVLDFGLAKLMERPAPGPEGETLTQEIRTD